MSDVNAVIINGGLDIGAFGALGAISGYAWKTVSQAAKSTVLNEAGLSTVEPLGAALVCGLFAAIDRLVQGIFQTQFGTQLEKPVFSILRIGGSTWASLKIFNLISSSLNLAKIETKAGAIMVITSIVLYTLIRPYINAHNKRE